MHHHHVAITEDGRSGTITYTEGALRIDLYWEYGGGDTLVIIQVRDAARWSDGTWPDGKREEVLRRVADAVVRQKAPKSRAMIDAAGGTIELVQGTRPDPQPQQAAAWVGRYRNLKGKLGLVVLIGGVLATLLFWIKGKVFSIDPGKGAPLGLAVRTDEHIAILMQELEAYTPTLHRSGADDTYRLSLLLVPLDGGAPTLIPFAEGLDGNSYQLAKVLGSDGRTLWFSAHGLHGVDLRTHELLSAEQVQAVDQSQLPKPWGGAPLEPRTEQYLAAGLFIGHDTWLGLHTDTEAQRDFKPKSHVKRVVQANEARGERRFHKGRLDPDSSGAYHTILSMAPIGDGHYVDAAFLRMDDGAEPIRLTAPPSAVLVHSSDAGLKRTLKVARVDHEGHLLWDADTGIDRSTLQQILPGETSTVFVGTRPPVESQVSEPLLVIVDHGTGEARTVSLWR